MSFTVVVFGTAPAGTVSVGSVFSCASTPAGSTGKLAIGVATTLGLVVQPAALVGAGGTGEADALLTGDDALVAFLFLLGRVMASTTATITITAPKESPIAVRRRARARACALATMRR